MEFNAFLAALLRRWYLTLAGVVLAIGVTAVMVIRIGPSYEAEAAVVLFPPMTTKSASGGETQENPYLMLGGLNQARDIVLKTMDSRSARDKFAEDQPTATYEAIQDFTTSGPIILITVEAPGASDAIAGLDSIVESVPSTLKMLQEGLGFAESAYISSRVLTVDSKAEVVRSGQIRAGIVVGVVILGAMLMLLGLLDGLLEGRARRASRTGRAATKSGRRGQRDAPSTSARSQSHSELSTDQERTIESDQPNVPVPSR